MTKSGKVYGSGSNMYDQLTDCRHNESDSSYEPYEIKMPAGHKAFEAYCCDRYYNFWINAKDGEGKTQFLTVGSDYDSVGRGSDGSCT